MLKRIFSTGGSVLALASFMRHGIAPELSIRYNPLISRWAADESPVGAQAAAGRRAAR